MILQTLTGNSEHSTEIKKSRFHAHAAPVESLDQALDFIASASIADASHNCWALRVGQCYRFHDDGEPSGTAGRPILAAIDGQSLDGVAVLVVRWFGGTRLGAGGLVRAYGGCAAEALRTAPRAPIVKHVELLLECDFALSASVHALLQAHQAEKTSEHYSAQGVQFQVRVPVQCHDALCKAVRDVSRGEARITPSTAGGAG